MIDEITIDKPATLRDIEQLMLTMSGDSSYIKPDHVPEELKTVKLCIMAMKNCGYAIRFVPEYMKTPRRCLIAVMRNGDMLRYVLESPRL